MKFDIEDITFHLNNSIILLTALGPETALMSDKGRYDSFDLIASNTWKRLEHPRPADQFTKAAVEDYTGIPAKIVKNLRHLINQFVQQRLIEMSQVNRL